MAEVKTNPDFCNVQAGLNRHMDISFRNIFGILGSLILGKRTDLSGKLFESLNPLSDNFHFFSINFISHPLLIAAKETLIVIPREMA